MKLRHALFALLLLCLAPIAAQAQTSIQFRDGSGSVLGTFGSGLVIFKAGGNVTITIASNTATISATGGSSGPASQINGHTFTNTLLNWNATTPAATSGWMNGTWQFADGSPPGAASVEFQFCQGGGTHNGGLVPDPGSGGSSTQYLGGDCSFHSLPSGAFYQTVQSHGSPVTQRAKLNFLAPLVAVDNSGNGSTDVSCPSCSGGGASNYQAIEVNGGSAFPAEPTLNFKTGTNTTVSCSDNPSNTSTDCTYSASGGGGGGFTAPVFWYPAMPTNVGSSLDTYPGWTSGLIVIFPFFLDGTVTFTKISFNIQADSSFPGDINDFGIYDSSGNLQANLGPVFYNSTGIKTTTVLQTSVTLAPGMYFWALTGAYGFSPLQPQGTTMAFDPYPISTSTTSTGGTLPSTITIPTPGVVSGAGSAVVNFALLP